MKAAAGFNTGEVSASFVARCVLAPGPNSRTR
jgi:hypothetical protein